jgi:hypothetical protein
VLASNRLDGSQHGIPVQAKKRILARGIVSLSGLVTSPPALRHPRIRLSTLGESGKSSWKGRRRLLRRALAAPCSGHGSWPPKVVSEPPAGAKCKPFHFVSGHSTRKYQISLCTQIFIGTRCFPCTTTLISIKDPPPLRMYKLPTICGSPSALDFVRRIGIVLSQSALP